MITKNQFIDRWQEYLLSGKYEQTQRCLYRQSSDVSGLPIGYCCLGIACLVGQSFGIPGSGWDEQQSPAQGLPGSWLDEIFGCTVIKAEYKEKKDYPLYYLNDDGVSFAEIAPLLDQLRDS